MYILLQKLLHDKCIKHKKDTYCTANKSKQSEIPNETARNCGQD